MEVRSWHRSQRVLHLVRASGCRPGRGHCANLPGEPVVFSGFSVCRYGRYFVRALRWKVLLHPLKPDTALRSRFAGVSIGFAINNIFVGRLGELARAFALTRVEPITLSGSVGSLVVERFLDAIVLGTLFLVPMALPSFPVAKDSFPGGSALFSVRRSACSRSASQV